MTGPVGAAYAALLRDGELRPDADQERAVAALDRLASALEKQAGPGLFGRLFGKSETGACGVYLWGGVGRGKSMLMDLAFERIEVSPKRRVHFHAFMLETHRRMREARSAASPTSLPARRGCSASTR
jgi:cell division protein ZapE